MQRYASALLSLQIRTYSYYAKVASPTQKIPQLTSASTVSYFFLYKKRLFTF